VLLLMHHSHFLLSSYNIDGMKYCVNWRMFERNSVAGKIFHIVLIHPLQ
jgi:hypothetical protein